jgi:hypothetical protein
VLLLAPDDPVIPAADNEPVALDIRVRFPVGEIVDPILLHHPLGLPDGVRVARTDEDQGEEVRHGGDGTSAALHAAEYSGLLGIGMTWRTGTAASSTRRATGHPRPAVLDHGIHVIRNDHRSPARLNLALRRRNWAPVLTGFPLDGLFSGTRLITHLALLPLAASEPPAYPEPDWANDYARSDDEAHPLRRAAEAAGRRAGSVAFVVGTVGHARAVEVSHRPGPWLPPRSAFVGIHFPAGVIVVAVRW